MSWEQDQQQGQFAENPAPGWLNQRSISESRSSLVRVTPQSAERQI